MDWQPSELVGDLERCLINNEVMHYDFRSGFMICDKCEEGALPDPPKEER